VVYEEDVRENVELGPLEGLEYAALGRDALEAL